MVSCERSLDEIGGFTASLEGDGIAYRVGGRGQLPPGAGYRLVAVFLASP